MTKSRALTPFERMRRMQTWRAAFEIAELFRISGYPIVASRKTGKLKDPTGLFRIKHAFTNWNDVESAILKVTSAMILETPDERVPLGIVTYSGGASLIPRGRLAVLPLAVLARLLGELQAHGRKEVGEDGPPEDGGDGEEQ